MHYVCNPAAFNAWRLDLSSSNWCLGLEDIKHMSKTDEEALKELNERFAEAADLAESHVLQMNLRSDNGVCNSEEDLMVFFRYINELGIIRNEITSQEVRMGIIKPEEAHYHGGL